MDSKHYVVEAGEYDEHGIWGVFSNLADAQKHATEVCINYYSKGERANVSITEWSGVNVSREIVEDRPVHLACYRKRERQSGKEMVFSIEHEPVNRFDPAVGKNNYRDEVWCVGTDQGEVLRALTEWILESGDK